MKSVLIVSTVTFSLIFGIVVVSTGLLENAINISLPQPVSIMSNEDLAAERLKLSLDAQRDRIQVSTERLQTLQVGFDVEGVMLAEQQSKLQAMIDELASAQTEFSDERETSISRLAKVYSAMKPAKAAPILETLDPQTVLEIVSRMKDRQAAKVLSAMNAGLASEISRRMSLKGESL